MRRQLQKEICLQTLSKRKDWAVFCEWLTELEKVAFERAYICKKDEQRDKYFGEIRAYRNLIEEIGDMKEKAKDTEESIKELKGRKEEE